MTKRLTISLEGMIFILGFLLSLINSSMLTIVTIITPIILIVTYRTRGALLSFILIQMRSILNPGIFCQYEDQASIAKWCIIFLLSFYLIISCSTKIDNKDMRRAISLVILFACYSIISSAVVSSYPLTAIFKVLSYVIPFVSIMMGIYTIEDVDWIEKLIIPLGAILFSGIILFRDTLGYFRNGYAFQGFISHPNVFGVMLALFIACYIYHERKIGLKQVVVILSALLLAVASGSRTGILSIVVCLIVYVLTLEINYSIKAVLLSVAIIAVVLLSLSSVATDYISRILFKGHFSSILFSRENQLTNNIDRFGSHVFIGTGFNVPYNSLTRSWQFSFDAVVENGNIILALLADTGVLGLVLFMIAYFRIYRLGAGMLATLFFVPFAVSMGEMSFFSTNNFGIIMYFMISIYAVDGARREAVSEV